MNSSFWISIFIQRKDGKKVMNYKIVEQVSRKKKSMSGVLRVVMIIFAVDTMRELMSVFWRKSSQITYLSEITCLQAANFLQWS